MHSFEIKHVLRVLHLDVFIVQTLTFDVCIFLPAIELDKTVELFLIVENENKNNEI